jgi:hypothetical protein
VNDALLVSVACIAMEQIGQAQQKDRLAAVSPKTDQVI